MQARGQWIVAAAIILVTFAAHFKAAEFGYVNYDDHRYVSENRRIDQGLTLDNVKWAFTTFELANWHPLTWLSYMLDTELFGPRQPGSAHVVNALLHACNSAILFALLWRMTASLWRSAFVAALFALHPLHVESVAWISERKDVLSTIFGFGAIWFYISYSKTARAFHLTLSAIFLALSLMAKPMFVTLPALLLLLDRWPLQRWRVWRDYRTVGRLILEKWPLIGLSAASCIVTIIAQHAGGALRDFTHVPPFARIPNAIVSYAIYLWQTIFPVDLVMFYPYPESRPVGTVALSAMVLIAISAVAALRSRKRPYLLVGWLWYIVALVPVIGLVQVGAQAHADRYTYVPLIGVFIMISWSLPSAPRGARIASSVSGIAALTILAVLLQFQLEYWRNDRTLAQHALAVTGDNEIGHWMMGNVTYDEGDFIRAVEHFEAATRLQPNWADAHNNLGNALSAADDAPRAIRAFQRAIELQPSMADAHFNLGVLLYSLERIDEAAISLRHAVDLQRHHTPALILLGAISRDRGRLDEALNYLVTAVRLAPEDPVAVVNLADVQAKLGRLEEARANFRRAAQLAELQGQDELRSQALEHLDELDNSKH